MSKKTNFEIAFELGAKMDPSVKRTFNQASKELQNFSSGVKDAVKKGAKIVAGIGTAAVGAGAAIGGISVKLSEVTASAEAMEAQFEQVFDSLEGDASKALNKIADDTGMLPNRLKASFTQIAAFAKTTGMDTADALALTERATLAAADSAAFYDRSIEDVIENLQSFLKGNYANDAALGISATETTRNAMANKLYGKSFKDLSEAQKQLTLLAMVEEGNKLSGALGQAAREADAWENQLGNLRQSWTDLKARLGEPILPIVIDKMQSLSGILQNIDTDTLSTGIEKFASKLDAGIDKAVELARIFKTEWLPVIREAIGTVLERAKEFYNFIKDNWSTIKPILIGITIALGSLKAAMIGIAIVKKITAFMKLFSAANTAAKLSMLGLNGAMLANPTTWLVAGIIALIAAGALLIKNWDKVKAAVAPVGEAISGAFQKAHDAITRLFSGIGEWFSGIWDGITSTLKGAVNTAIIFVNKAINGLNKISVTLPKWFPGDLAGKTFGINIPNIPYLAEGGIVTKPTLAMIGEGNESEAVLPISKLKAFLGGNNSTTANSQRGGQGVQIIYSPVYNIPSNATKADIEEVSRTGYEDFKRWIKKYERDKKRRDF